MALKASMLLMLLMTATPAFAAPPENLANFQNELACSAAAPNDARRDAANAANGPTNTPLIVRPRTLGDVRQAVRSYTPVQAVGEGHSWNAPFFCPGDPEGGFGNATAPPTTTTTPTPTTAAGIAMTTIRPLRIVVDEASQTVTADAGVIVGDLLDFLALYATPRAPAGYTFPAFPWFVYQSVGGAIATGTHGSSIEHGSLSSQLVALELITADGSLRRFTEASDPFLFRAVRIHAGRLGVNARLTFRIVPEEPVKRELRLVPESTFLKMLREVQDAWNGAGAAREGTGLPDAATQPRARREALLRRAKSALPRWTMDGQAFWLPERRQFYVVTFERASEAGCGLFSSGGGGGSGYEAVVVAADANTKNSTASCAEFLRRYRPQETTRFNASRMAFSPTGQEPLVPSAGGLLSFGDALRPLASSLPSSSAAPLLPFTSSLPALRDLADRKLTKINDTTTTGGADGIAWAPPMRRLRPQGPYAVADGTLLSVSGLSMVAGNTTAEASNSFIRQPERTLNSLMQTVFTQYEVAIPLSNAADCIAELTRAVDAESARVKAAATEEKRRLESSSSNDTDTVLLIPPHNTTSTTGFFTAPLLRFVGPEDALLSLAGLDHGVALFINMEDYLSSRAASSSSSNNNTNIDNNNPSFKKAMAVLRGSPQCRGSRLHLGKAGWPARGCWRGDEEYGDRWCDFGCALRALKGSEEKFASAAPDRWTWEGVDLERCCGDGGDGGDQGGGGFLAAKAGCACRASHARPKESCPPAPFY